MCNRWVRIVASVAMAFWVGAAFGCGETPSAEAIAPPSNEILERLVEAKVAERLAAMAETNDPASRDALGRAIAETITEKMKTNEKPRSERKRRRPKRKAIDFAKLRALQDFMQATQAKTVEVNRFVKTDPKKAVAVIEELADLAERVPPQVREMHEKMVASLTEAQAAFPRAGLSKQLGRSLFFLGRFKEAATVFGEAAKHARTQRLKLVGPEEDLCWQAVCARRSGDKEGSNVLLAQAEKIAADHEARRARGRAALQAAGQPPFAHAGRGPSVRSHKRGRGLAKIRGSGGQRQRRAGARQAGGDLEYCRQRYVAAKRQLDHATTIYKQQLKFGNQIAGRSAALGAYPGEFAPQGIDPQVQQEYYAAKQAYEQAKARAGR